MNSDIISFFLSSKYFYITQSSGHYPSLASANIQYTRDLVKKFKRFSINILSTQFINICSQPRKTE